MRCFSPGSAVESGTGHLSLTEPQFLHVKNEELALESLGFFLALRLPCFVIGKGR